MSVPIWRGLNFSIIGDGVSTSATFDISDAFSLGSPSLSISAKATGVLPDGNPLSGPITTGPTVVTTVPSLSHNLLTLTWSAPLQANSSYTVQVGLLF